VVTTDSNQGRKGYPNLARQMVMTDVDQLWRADITYIRLREEFVISGCRSGCLLAPLDRLGTGPGSRSTLARLQEFCKQPGWPQMNGTGKLSGDGRLLLVAPNSKSLLKGTRKVWSRKRFFKKACSL
jgi:hypothetical protein